MEKIRCFVAIELPPQIKAQLSALEERLKTGRQPFAKWVNPSSIHLTLKFLGNVSTAKVPEIVEAISSTSEGKSPFNLQLGSLGAFPNWQRPRVVWVGMGGETAKLAGLQRDIETALSPLGFPPESRSFSPHLTLARFREGASPEERRGFAEHARAIGPDSPLLFEVDAVVLMRSQLTPSGAIYSRLANIEL